MPLASWLEDEVGGSAVEHFIAEQCAYASLDDPAVLIFVVVAMKRCAQRSRRHRMLEDREAPFRIKLVEDVADTDRALEHRLAFGAPHRLSCRAAWPQDVFGHWNLH